MRKQRHGKQSTKCQQKDSGSILKDWLWVTGFGAGKTATYLTEALVLKRLMV